MFRRRETKKDHSSVFWDQPICLAVIDDGPDAKVLKDFPARELGVTGCIAQEVLTEKNDLPFSLYVAKYPIGDLDDAANALQQGFDSFFIDHTCDKYLAQHLIESCRDVGTEPFLLCKSDADLRKAMETDGKLLTISGDYFFALPFLPAMQLMWSLWLRCRNAGGRVIFMIDESAASMNPSWVKRLALKTFPDRIFPLPPLT